MQNINLFSFPLMILGWNMTHSWQYLFIFFVRCTCSWGWGWKRKNLPVFLAEPCTPVPVAAPGVPGLPGTPVFLLSRLLKKLASTPSFAAAPINTHKRNIMTLRWQCPNDIHQHCEVFKSKHTSRFTINQSLETEIKTAFQLIAQL